MALPKILVRPSDQEIFTLNTDGTTYSNDMVKTMWPDHLHVKWTYDCLISYGFYTPTSQRRHGHQKTKQALPSPSDSTCSKAGP